MGLATINIDIVDNTLIQSGPLFKHIGSPYIFERFGVCWFGFFLNRDPYTLTGYYVRVLREGAKLID